MAIVRAGRILPNGSWSEAPFDTITLDEEDRYRRRIQLTSDNGLDFMLSLAKPCAWTMAMDCSLKTEGSSRSWPSPRNFMRFGRHPRLLFCNWPGIWAIAISRLRSMRIICAFAKMG